ncbi:MAG TPA: hypothetical protein DCS08_00490 [Candidatus Moranbacteria bacterium]|nr:hypothetical protein [Candidatus Moranbacteria bacterium]HBY10828.1 hypothetical protein [Candidatus Moranbacteria bacterium]
MAPDGNGGIVTLPLPSHAGITSTSLGVASTGTEKIKIQKIINAVKLSFFMASSCRYFFG